MSYISEIRKKIGHDTVIMPCACAIIADGRGKILLQKRADDGCWGYHGGAVEVDERVEDALMRELKEELGVMPLDYEFFGIYSGPDMRHVYPNGDDCSCIDIVYLCTKFSGKICFSDGEVTELRWFSQDDLPENLSQSSRQPIADYFRKFQGKVSANAK